MLISRRHEVPGNQLPNIKLEGKALPIQASINVLGVEFDKHLTFTNHVRDLARKCGSKLACIRRVSHLLDRNGCSVLYNSQIRPLMEYSPLVWSSCPPSYLRLLDRVQERARRLVENRMSNTDSPIFFQSLQHRRDVAGLCVFYKIHRLQCPHLASLRLSTATGSGYNIRRGNVTGHQLHVPFARTELYIRSFQPRYSRLWNKLVQDINLHQVFSMQQFKTRAHQWRLANSAV